ncbi:MAG: hypothetical protein K8J08_08355 [Thermoanaerobaculia bacterium]|nr:hypothetical protein [Thermoanaerobaculia bacterium]
MTVAILAVALSGCGKKGDPLPPLRTIPNPTRDLAVTQQGDVLSLRMSYPSTTTDGALLPGLDAVELWQTVRPVADPERPPVVEAREFEATANRLLVIQGPELLAATEGAQLVSRLPLSGLAEDPVQLHVFAIRSLATGGELSAFSNLVHLVPEPAPTPPGNVSMEPGPEGILLHWDAPPEPLEGYNIYRRPAQAHGYAAPLAFKPAESVEFLDETARFEQRYIYTVTAVSSRDPLRESSFSKEREVEYIDIFPPAPPSDLVALPRTGGADLVWRPSPDADTVGYVVYRADPGLDFLRITPDPLTSPELTDAGLASGVTYRYQVSAVDGEGNEGPPSQTATLTTP